MILDSLDATLLAAPVDQMRSECYRKANRVFVSQRYNLPLAKIMRTALDVGFDHFVVGKDFLSTLQELARGLALTRYVISGCRRLRRCDHFVGKARVFATAMA